MENDTGSLVLEDLTRRYGDVVALDGLSFSVPQGTMFGFVGPNGAGKTTTMRIVLGVLEADAGHVRWRGEPIDAEVRRRFGYMPEERGLYPKMRVGDQLTYMARLHGVGAAEAAGAAERWAVRLGLGERIGSRVEELSLGNQQRVQLGAALVHDPELLVLDEPFSGLDPEGVDVLSSVLAERAEAGVPVVFAPGRPSRRPARDRGEGAPALVSRLDGHHFRHRRARGRSARRDRGRRRTSTRWVSRAAGPSRSRPPPRQWHPAWMPG